MYTSTIFTSGVAPRGLGAEFDAAVQALQTALNADLAKLGCRRIGTDGKLGPETCGALNYVITQGPAKGVAPSTAVAAGTAQLGKCTKFSYSCRAAVAPAPSALRLLAHEPYVSPSQGIKASTLVMGGTVVLAVGVLGYAIAKKKGMI